MGLLDPGHGVTYRHRDRGFAVVRWEELSGILTVQEIVYPQRAGVRLGASFVYISFSPNIA